MSFQTDEVTGPQHRKTDSFRQFTFVNMEIQESIKNDVRHFAVETGWIASLICREISKKGKKVVIPKEK